MPKLGKKTKSLSERILKGLIYILLYIRISGYGLVFWATHIHHNKIRISNHGLNIDLNTLLSQFVKILSKI